MSELFKTNLVIVSSPLPADFEGTPQAFQAAILERMAIQSPVGTNFFIVGDIEPSTNLGPWLRGGRAWYIFDESTGRYVPADVSASAARLFTVSSDEPLPPTGDEATIWLKTFGDRVIGWYFWTGTEWRPGGNRPPSGSTANRPASPQDLEQYYDTDISCFIHFERGSWRTLSGSPNDIKFVSTSILGEALTKNPGWVYYGQDDQSIRGRSICIATKDPGATPTDSFITDSNITPRAAGDEVGSETHTITSAQIEQHTHLLGNLSNVTAPNVLRFYRVDGADVFSTPLPGPPNWASQDSNPSGSNEIRTGSLPASVAGAGLVSSKQLSLSNAPSYSAAAEPHNNIQPSIYLWALRKT